MDCGVSPRCAHTGNAPFAQQPGGFGQPRPAFEFDYLRPLTHQDGGVFQALRLGVITHERQVRHQQRTVIATAHTADVIGGVLDGNRQTAVMPLDHHAEGITDQQNLDPGPAGGKCAAIVIYGQRGEFFTGGFHSAEGADGGFFGARLGRHGGIGFDFEWAG